MLADMANCFDETGGRIETSLNALDTGLREDAGRFAETIDQAGENLAGLLDGRIQHFGEASEIAALRIASTFDDKTSHIDERLSTMDRALGMGLDSVSKMIDGKASGLAATLRGAVVDATSTMDETAQRTIEDVTALKSLHYADELAARGTGFAATLTTQAEEFVGHLETRAGAFVADTASRSEDFVANAAGRSQEFARTIRTGAGLRGTAYRRRRGVFQQDRRNQRQGRRRRLIRPRDPRCHGEGAWSAS